MKTYRVISLFVFIFNLTPHIAQAAFPDVRVGDSATFDIASSDGTATKVMTITSVAPEVTALITVTLQDGRSGSDNARINPEYTSQVANLVSQCDLFKGQTIGTDDAPATVIGAETLIVNESKINTCHLRSQKSDGSETTDTWFGAVPFGRVKSVTVNSQGKQIEMLTSFTNGSGEIAVVTSAATPTAATAAPASTPAPVAVKKGEVAVYEVTVAEGKDKEIRTIQKKVKSVDASQDTFSYEENDKENHKKSIKNNNISTVASFKSEVKTCEKYKAGTTLTVGEMLVTVMGFEEAQIDGKKVMTCHRLVSLPNGTIVEEWHGDVPFGVIKMIVTNKKSSMTQVLQSFKSKK